MKIFWRVLKNKFIISGLVLLIIFGYWFLRSKNKSEQTYQTEKVAKETIIQTVSASGQIVTSSNFPVTTQASGVVKNVYMVNGQVIKKGDKILEVELDLIGQQKQTSAWLNYLSAKNNLETAQANLYSLQADMFDKWNKFYQLATNSTYQNPDGTANETNRALPEFHIAEKNWLAAEAKYKNQQNQITQAQIALQNAWLDYQLVSSAVVAPADGILTDLIYAPGMVINSASETSSGTETKIATIKSQGFPFGKFNVYEIDVAKIKPGQKATIIINSLPDKTFTGEVIAIDKTGVVSSSVVSYPLTVKFDEENEEILPNMSATANIIINRKSDILTVPSSAIVKQNSNTYVRVLRNGRAVLTPVETGISSETKTEIISGLNEGETVIVSIRNQTFGSSSQTQSPFSGFGVGGQRIRIR